MSLEIRALLGNTAHFCNSFGHEPVHNLQHRVAQTFESSDFKRLVQGLWFLVLGLGSRVRADLDAEMCSGSEAGSYLRLIDFVYHSTLGLREIKKKKGDLDFRDACHGVRLRHVLERACGVQASGRTGVPRS
jgi:hypothetical protein